MANPDPSGKWLLKQRGGKCLQHPNKRKTVVYIKTTHFNET